MLTINVLLEVKESKRDDYIKFVNELVEASRKEEGCLFYSHFEEVYCRNHFAIVENWANQAAVDAHNETEHFKEFADNISDYLAKDLDLKVSQS